MLSPEKEKAMLYNLSEGFSTYFSLTTFRGKLLIASIIILSLLVVVGVIISLQNKEIFKNYLLVAFGLLFVYSIIVFGICVQKELTDNAEYLQDYQKYFAISTIISVIIGLIFMIFASKSNLVATKKPLILAIGIGLTAITIIFFIVSIVLNKGGKEFLTEKAQVSLAVTLITAILSGVVFITIGTDKEKNTSKSIAFAAIFIAMASALQFVRLFRLPQGGSITLGSLAPLAIYSYMFGWKKGVLACFLFGVIQSFIDPFIVHPLQYFLDYPLAFSMIGLSGAFKNKKCNISGMSENGILKPVYAISFGFGIGIFVRYICHVMSGIVYFGAYAAEGYSAVKWGIVYNLFAFADGLIALVAIIAFMANWKAYSKAMKISQ